MERNLNLSKTMLEVIEAMKTHGNLVRYDGGFWSWEDVEIEHVRFNRMQNFDVPAWHCDVKTLRALERRGLVELDEKMQVCRLIEDLVQEEIIYGNWSHM